MTTNTRAIKALEAMKDLGISEDEVRPVLLKLYKLYDKKWELIEDDNYRTLIDAYFESKEDKAYFESKEDKQEEHKRKAPASCHDGEKPKQKLHLVDIDNQVLSADNSRQVLQDMKLTTNSQAFMAARDRKIYPGAASSEGRCKDPIDGPCHRSIQRKNMSRGNDKPKSHPGSVSTSCNGSLNASNGNLTVKSLSDVYQNTHKIEATPTCNNNTRTSKGNIDIGSSSPLGEVKSSLDCDAALRTGLNLSRNGSRQTLSEDKKKSFRYVEDITKGSENIKISLLDETNSEDFPKFNYIPCNTLYQSANVNISLARIADEDCCSDCLGDCLSLSVPCACSQETGGEFAYTSQGLLSEKFLTDCMSMVKEPQHHHYVFCKECPIERTKNETKPESCKGHLVRKFIKECWRKCGCDMQCGNRVVQRGLSRKLQVFLTQEGKGWGVRTLEDLPKGSFVCEYAGEILTNSELYDRIVYSTGNDRHTYPVTLDADWGSEVGLQDEEALCLDATNNGNVARFINHRCSDANLIDIPVEVETPDRHYYHLALFTNKDVSAYEELTWDYGIDFDDHTHPIEAFQCCCGSAFCRDRKQKGLFDNLTNLLLELI
ncbi:histone-lysine N-methyltransferase SUVR2-like protein [Medicago truncatula]|uniref:Histone-lysine N-methyltransferase SUVR2-like protein n=1 Tax=Medicago truncatula TaxID=3880 RepID=G7I6T4_MEDTR|nr:histone-lysine N-methyltransferase SUVR2-like protein [Medicago truncatula]